MHREQKRQTKTVAAIRDFCRRTGQPVPADEGAVLRCCLESLAMKYRWVLERLEEPAASALCSSTSTEWPAAAAALRSVFNVTAS